MKILSKTEAIASLSDYVEQIKDDSIVVTVQGRPVAILLSVENVDLETITLSTNPGFLAIIERSRLRDKTEGRASHETVKQMFV
jgi:prevent-host-death family protein